MQTICIVVPCYNEQDRLPVKALDDFLKTSDSIYFCLVNDGSRDDTGAAINALQSRWTDKIIALHLPENEGKAEAVRRGVLRSLAWKDFAYIGYFDADLSAPLSEIQLLLDNIRVKETFVMAFGSRVKRLGAFIIRNELRHYASRFIATLISKILCLPVYDTQCGAKLIDKIVAAKVFSEPFLSRWLFDVEIFARIIKIYGRENIHDILIEVPLRQWINKPGSKIRLGYLFKLPFELMKISMICKRS